MNLLTSRYKQFAFIWLLFLIFLIYGNSLRNGFLLDDYTVLLNNPLMHSFKNVFYVLRGSDSPDLTTLHYFRPVSILFRMGLYQLFAANAFGYHLTNVLLFVVHCFLLFLLFERLTDNVRAALLAVTLYAVHPIHTTVVDFAMAHEGILLGIFSSLTALFFLRKLERLPTESLGGWSLFFYGLALLTQEITILLPLFLFCIAIFQKSIPWRKAFRLVIPYFVILLGYIFFKLEQTHTSSQILLSSVIGSSLKFPVYVNTLFQLLFWYCSRLFYPQHIVLIWSPGPAASSAVYTLLGAGLLLGLCLLLIRWRRSVRSLALIWFSLGFLPVFVLCFIYFYAMGLVIEPHWFFFTSAGFFLLLALLLLSIKRKFWSRMVVVAVVGVILYWGKTTSEANLVWKDENTYARYWLSVVPRNPYALRAIGQSEKDPRQAVRYFKKALQLLPHYLLYNEIGNAYANMKEFPVAKENLYQSLTLNPNQAAPLNTLGTIAIQEGHLPESENFFRRALAVNPLNVSARLNLADAYILGHQLNKALAILDNGLYLDLNFIDRKDILVERILLLYELGRTEESLQTCKLMLSEIPGPETMLLLGQAFYERGHPQVALDLMKKYIKIYPQRSEGYLLGGVILASHGEYAKALALWQEGSLLNPGDGRFQDNILKIQKMRIKERGEKK